MSTVPAGGRGGARTRIIEGAARCVVEVGPTASMAELAAAAGVSKALLHYHFPDRAHLLAEVVRTLATRLVTRERAAMGDEDVDRAAAPPPPGNAVDVLWRWTSAELRAGELQALLDLGTIRELTVREAWHEAATLRRKSAARTIALLFERLGLVPRMPPALLGDAATAYLDGLALDSHSNRDARVGFDLFWLALLSLGD